MFEWDDKKNKENLRKHGISFEAAKAIFDGPVLIEEDDREDYGETRYIGIGLIGNESFIIVLVVYTERGQNKRIISARRALKHEREKFETFLLNRGHR